MPGLRVLSGAVHARKIRRERERAETESVCQQRAAESWRPSCSAWARTDRAGVSRPHPVRRDGASLASRRAPAPPPADHHHASDARPGTTGSSTGRRRSRRRMRTSHPGSGPPAPAPDARSLRSSTPCGSRLSLWVRTAPSLKTSSPRPCPSRRAGAYVPGERCGVGRCARKARRTRARPPLARGLRGWWWLAVHATEFVFVARPRWLLLGLSRAVTSAGIGKPRRPLPGVRDE